MHQSTDGNGQNMFQVWSWSGGRKSKSIKNMISQLKSAHNGNSSKPAILITGATHARELISTSLVAYEMLQLLQLGEVQKEGKWPELLAKNKYYYLPIFNVDGVANIE